MEVPVNIEFAQEKKLFFTGFTHGKAALWKSCEWRFSTNQKTHVLSTWPTKTDEVWLLTSHSGNGRKSVAFWAKTSVL
jgi:hypothetical protein